MNFDTIIFDWAGTTIDFGCMAPVAAFISAFAEAGITVSIEQTRSPMGLSKWDHIRQMLTIPEISEQFYKKYQRNPIDTDINQINEYFTQRLLRTLADFAQPKPYLLETITKLRAQGMRIGSTTGYTRQMMEIVASSASKAGYTPDCYVCAEDVGQLGRPYPYMLFQAMQRLQAQSVKSTVKVGDTLADIAEGYNAGVKTIGIIDGSSEMGLNQAAYDALSQNERNRIREKVRTRYLDHGADAVIIDLSELEEALNQLVST